MSALQGERTAQKPDPAETEAGSLDIKDGPAATLTTDRRNPRIYLQKGLAGRLIKLGVPNDGASLGKAVNELADMSVSLGYAYLPDATDLATLEAGIHDRLEELTAVTMSLMQLLVELGATGEYRTLLHSFKKLAQDNAPKAKP
jgi:hypothetical protein